MNDVEEELESTPKTEPKQHKNIRTIPEILEEIKTTLDGILAKLQGEKKEPPKPKPKPVESETPEA